MTNLIRRILANKCISQCKSKPYSTYENSKQLFNLLKQKQSKLREIELSGWCLLIVPITTFGLGVWQVKRKTWKENLIKELKERTQCPPIKLPENLTEIDNLEYKPIHVRGTFLNNKEVYIGPRTLVAEGKGSLRNGLFSNASTQGYLVITPFKLEGRKETILINRGWVPARNIDQKTRLNGQPEGVVDVIGLVRLNETRPQFSMKNKPGHRLLFYRDLDSICQMTGASPVFLDQTDEFNIPNGPIGGQTRLTLRNEHLSYIITWFSLTGFTGYIWFKKFLAV